MTRDHTGMRPTGVGIARGPSRAEVDRPLAPRDQFPILEHANYLISNSLGAVPIATGASLQSYYETWATRGVRAWEESWWSLVSNLGDLVAPRSAARPGEARSSNPT